MAGIVVTGAGIGGLTTAMLLAGDGHDVTVLERDAAPPPEPSEAWTDWERRGVNQFRMLHFFQPRFRAVIETELPALVSALDRAGALRINPLALAPDQLTGGPREGDGDFEALTGRRPVVEAALAATAAETSGVTIRRGTAVASLCTGRSARGAIPHITGIRTDSGEQVTADLVVDATGRRSSLPDLLEASGGRRPVEELEDCGFIYYGRHFRSADGSIPALIGPPLQDYGTFSILTLPADNGTWGIGLIVSAKDAALRGLRDVGRWAAIVRSLPLCAHWLDGDPIDEQIAVMAKIEDRHRSFLVDGTPIATGVVAVADSWACTNPSVGRGATIGLLHAVALRDVMRQPGLSDPLAFAERWEAVTNEIVEPWYRATLSYDRHRLAEIDAAVEGKPYEPGDLVWEMTKGLRFAAGQDPDCLRGFASIAGLVRTADEVFADPAVFEKVVTVGAAWRDAPMLGPSRDELLALAVA